MSALIDNFAKQTDRRQVLKGLAAGAGLLAAPHVARAAARLTIAMVPKSLDLPVFAYGHYGAIKRAAELDTRINPCGLSRRRCLKPDCGFAAY